MVTNNPETAATQDVDLKRRVVNYLVHQNMRTLRDVDVQTDGGTVVLSGRVDSYHEKQLCLNCCRRVAGVTQLVDEISVSQAATLV